MSEGTEIAGALAIYRTPDELVAAVNRARSDGFTRMDVVSPYPLHGIDAVLGRRPSRLGYGALVAALAGTAIAKIAQWWMSAVDYPLNIGGKPLWSWPGLIPVTFEFMVLFTAITVVVGMLGVLNRLPQYGNSILRSRYIRDLTSDKFGLVIDASDPEFDASTIAERIAGEGAIGVDILRRELPDPYYARRVLSLGFLAFLAAVTAAAAFGTWVVMRYTGEVPPFDFMKRQAKLVPYERSEFFADQHGMRPPVAGTVARGALPYFYGTDPEGAGANLFNPVPVTEENIARGEDQYGVFCRPCHGVIGDGTMTLTAAFPRPPTLHSQKVREWPDGRIFHVITMGQNNMPSYAAQIDVADRWRIILFVRALQRSRNAPESDVAAPPDQSAAPPSSNAAPAPETNVP